MGYCCNETPVRTVTLSFKRAELLYDVSNYAFVEGDILPEDSEHGKHQVFDICQDGNIDRVTRVLNLAHAECVEMLYPFAKEEIPEEPASIDDILMEPEEYVIRLSLPSGFSMTTVRLIEHIIHEYLVGRVLSDWLGITNPPAKSNWEARIEDLRSRMKTVLTYRRGKVRRPLKPF